MDVYTREEIAAQRSVRKKYKKAAWAASALAALLCFYLFMRVNPLNEAKFRLMACALAGLAGCFDIYAATFILPYLRPKTEDKSAGKRILRVLSNILHQAHMYIIWILFSSIMISFIFNALTDAAPEKKMQIYIDAPSFKGAELEYELGRDLPEGIRLVKVYPLDYHMFGSGSLASADILIVTAPWLLENAESFEMNGFVIKKKGGGVSFAASFIEYGDEDYYLIFGPKSLHLGEGGAAEYVAKQLSALK